MVPKHAKGGEENGEQAESMESGASYAIAQKRGPSYARSELHSAPRLDSEFHMEAEVPPVSARNQRRRSQKIWGGAEVRQSGGHGT